jgi:hypothetical protein
MTIQPHDVDPEKKEPEPQPQPVKKPPVFDHDFNRFLRFGTIDNSLLIISMMAGLSVDAFIAKRVGVKGYGTLLGACVGNSISDGVAASPEGRNASLGALSGSLIPLLPIAVAMGFRLPFERPSVRYSVATTSVGLLCWAFGMQKWFDRHKHTHNIQPTSDPAHISKKE